MRKIIIFGNSGSGKSTLALKLKETGLAHLDLDTLAWDMNPEPIRKAIETSHKTIKQFIDSHDTWVIEGCYGDLIDLIISEANEIIYLNLNEELCIINAKSRPWEAHKYASKQDQDNNLDMLIDWIKQYSTREDTFSKAAHEHLYNTFTGKKTMYTTNLDMQLIC